MLFRRLPGNRELSGKSGTAAMLTGVPGPVAACYTIHSGVRPGDPERQVVFDISEHAGYSLNQIFDECHILPSLKSFLYDGGKGR
jgi:hypothetical protein